MNVYSVFTHLNITLCKYNKLLIGVFGHRFLGLAVVVSYLLIVIMRWIAGPVILFCVILFIASFGFGKYLVLCGT